MHRRSVIPIPVAEDPDEQSVQEMLNADKLHPHVFKPRFQKHVYSICQPDSHTLDYPRTPGLRCAEK
jgi:hypothetical protein